MNIDQLAKRHEIDPEDLMLCIIENGFTEHVIIGTGVYDTHVSGTMVPVFDAQIKQWLVERVISVLSADQPSQLEGDEEPLP